EMSVVEKHAPGSFCWVELGTTDAKAAKQFYSGLFGWQAHDMPMGPDGFYTMLKIDGKDVGAMYELNKNMREVGVPTYWMQYTEIWNEGRPIGGMMQTPKQWDNVPPHWVPYFRVADCDASTTRAKELGGSIKVPATDIPKVGRFTVLQDPQGAIFSIIQLAVG